MPFREPLLAAAVACCLTAGCAATPETTAEAQQPNVDNVYRTGSRLPPRDPVNNAGTNTMSKDDWINNSREGLPDPASKTR